MTVSSATDFAKFVATLGRGPGRSRALTRDEAETAFGMVLPSMFEERVRGASGRGDRSGN